MPIFARHHPYAAASQRPKKWEDAERPPMPEVKGVIRAGTVPAEPLT